MRKFIYSGLSLIFTVLMFASCDKAGTDMMTGEAKTGGLVSPTGSVAYKLGMTPTFDIVVDIPKGPGIKSIEVFKNYTRAKDTVQSNTVSTVVAVDGANEAADVQKKITQSWALLRTGLTMPSAPQIPVSENDPNIANFIGDYWTFTYVCTMNDGRVITNTQTTKVAIANFFAGTYDCFMDYFHPTAGGTYPTSAYGGDRLSKVDLVPTGALDCKVYFGVWTTDYVYIHIAPDYKVTLTIGPRTDAIVGDPYNAANVCSYDPATGIIKLYYYYPGAGGPRVFWAFYTPKK